MSVRWVCSRSQGQRLAQGADQLLEAGQLTADRRRRHPAGSRATSGGRGRRRGRARPTPPWSPPRRAGRAAAARSRRRRAASSRASLMSDSTWRVSHWATSSGPRSPAASTANRWPSTMRTPDATGSTPSARPRQVEERQRRQDPHIDPVVGAEQLDRALGDQRGPGHGVQHVAVLGRGLDQRIDDAGVDLLDSGGRLVRASNEAAPGSTSRGRRVPGGATKRTAGGVDGAPRAARSAAGAARAEPDHDGGASPSAAAARASAAGAGEPAPPWRPWCGVVPPAGAGGTTPDGTRASLSTVPYSGSTPDLGIGDRCPESGGAPAARWSRPSAVRRRCDLAASKGCSGEVTSIEVVAERVWTAGPRLDRPAARPRSGTGG